MHHLLLVSTLAMNPRMALFESKEELIVARVQNSSKTNLSLKKDPILCNYCKRSASNGVRCL